MSSKLSPAMVSAMSAMKGYTAERIDTTWWTWWQVVGPNHNHISTRTMSALERRGLVEIYGNRFRCAKLKDKIAPKV